MELSRLHISTNVLAILLASALIIFCLSISYFFQKRLFSRYRRKVANAAEKEEAGHGNQKP